MNKYRDVATRISRLTSKQLSAGSLSFMVRDDPRHERFVKLVKYFLEGVRFDDISDMDSLVEFTNKLIAIVRQMPDTLPTARQWLGSARLAGLSEDEQQQLTAALGKTLLYEELSVDVHTIHLVDGNTVKKLGGQSSTRRAAKGDLSVQIYLSGDVDTADEVDLQRSIEELLLENDAILAEAGQPVRGSFFQILKFFGSVKSYGYSLASNLRTAFGSAAKSYDIEAVGKLSKIIAKHDNAVIRIGDTIAVKVTRNDKTFTVILDQLTTPIKKHLDENPELIAQPGRLFDLLEPRVSVLARAKPSAPDDAGLSILSKE